MTATTQPALRSPQAARRLSWLVSAPLVLALLAAGAARAQYPYGHPSVIQQRQRQAQAAYLYQQMLLRQALLAQWRQAQAAAARPRQALPKGGQGLHRGSLLSRLGELRRQGFTLDYGHYQQVLQLLGR